MKHLLNNLSEEEKNSIREQHEGGMKLDTSRFRTLLEGKSGNVKPLVEQEDDYPKINLRKHFDKERELNPDLMGDDEWAEFNNSFEDKDIEIYNRKRFDKERELEEDFEGGEKPLNLLQRFYMYLRGTNSEISELPDDFFNEFIEDISDESTSEILVDVIRLNNPDFREFEERELGYSQHDGSFGGDDSEDEEELDLTEFDDLEGDDSEDEGYEEEPNEEIFSLIDDECVNSKNDEDCVTFLNTVIEYCEDKLYEMGQYGGSDEEEDLGDFEGDDSEDEEELDLTEFDDLEEDETW